MAKNGPSSDSQRFWRNVIIGVAVKIVIIGAAMAVAITYYL